jgi:hypothetical protein
VDRENRLAPAAVFVAISTSVSTPACCVTACLGMLLEFVSFPTKASVEGRERLLWSPRDPAA